MNADYPSTKTQPKLTAADYHGTSIQLIEKDGSRWLTARDLGLCLGYSEANARQGIINLYNRHLDEFTEKDSCEIKLISQGQERNTRIFSPSGCHLLSFFASTTRAKDFRAWAKEVLVQAKTSFPIFTTALQMAYSASRGLKTSGIAASAPVSCGFFMPAWATRYVGRAKNTIPARGITPAVYFRLLSLPTPIATGHGTTSKK